MWPIEFPDYPHTDEKEPKLPKEPKVVYREVDRV